MAYKRTSKKSGSFKHTTTINTNGPTTRSVSHTSNGNTTTYTTKGNKSWTTQTIRSPSGWVERRRIGSSNPRKPKKVKNPIDDFFGNVGMIIGFAIIIISILASIGGE